MSIMRKIIKALFVENIYCIGYRYAKETFAYEIEQPEFVMQVLNWKKWCADPIICVENEKTYVFVEEMNRLTNRAHISVMSLDQKDGLGLPQGVIKEAFHMSFPETFTKDGNTYMIPETSEAGELRVYRKGDTVFDWKCELVFEEKCIDVATINRMDGLYLIASKENPENHHKTILKIYLLDIEKGTLKKCDHMEAECCYAYNARNGGKVIQKNDSLYRVAQQSTREFYGKSVDIFQIDQFCPECTYEEHKVGDLTIDKICCRYKNRFYKPAGMHTYGHVNGYEVIDVNTEHFSLLVPFQKILRLLARRFM